MHTEEQNANKGKIEDIDKLVDEVVAYMRDARLEDALSYVKQYVSNTQRLCGKTDYGKIVRVDAAVKRLCATVGHMKTKAPATNATLDRVVSLLRRFRNAFVNVNTFPEELLRAVFVWLNEVDVAEKTRLASTCSRWREVCLAFPAFWAAFTASGSNCALMNAALSKAKGLPLTVAVSRLDNHLGAVMFALDEHGPAIRSLQLSLCSYSLFSHVSVWLPKLSLPCLREFRLTYQPPDGLAQTVDVKVLPDLPNAGRLETVVLTNCRWSYTPSVYSGLKSLSLLCDTNQEPDYFLHDDLGRLCSALTGSPDLAELTLCHPFMDAGEFLETRAMPPVPLLHLRSLRVRMALEKASALLSRIQTSPDELKTVVLILTAWKARLGAYVPDLDRSTLLSIPHPESLPILTRLRSLSLSHGHTIVGGFAETLPAPQDWDAVRPDPDPDADSPWCPPPGLYIHFSMPDSCWVLKKKAFGNFLTSVVEHYVLEGLQTLRLERFDWGVEEVMSVLRIAPRLRTLVLGVHTQPDRVLKAIADKRGASDAELEGVDAHSPFLPELRAVRLVDADLELHPEVLPVLCAAVNGLGLRSLSFEACRSSLEAAELAERVRAECPGLEGFCCVDLVRCRKLKSY